jgi:hypothetical protein
VVTDTNNVYWTDLATGGGSILSMPLHGGTVVTTMAKNLGSPNHLAVDSKNVYTANFSSTGGVYAIPLGSSGTTPAPFLTAAFAVGVAADESDLLYFSTSGAICTVKKP